MDRRTFNRIREIVYEKSGISLSQGKEALVRARIGKRMRALNIPEHKAYLQLVLDDESGEEVVHLLDAISTNVTSYFREANHFDFLREAVQGWLEEGQKRFRFWSAACSTGEEPYTMAMVLHEVASHYRGVDIKILATDISTRALSQAMHGTYEEQKIKGVPKSYLNRYFHKSRQDSKNYFTADGILKNMIVFRRLNLSQPPFPMKGPLDVVLCRNVMIYFDNAVRKRLLDNIYRLLRPSGYLMVGHAESLTGMVSDFRSVKPAIYIK
jgi:chemotaxis protein methyltransferase CheR